MHFACMDDVKEWLSRVQGGRKEESGSLSRTSQRRRKNGGRKLI